MSIELSPLAATLDYLGSVETWFGAEIGRPADFDPGNKAWVALADAVGLIPAWLDQIAAHYRGQRDVAASFLGGWLAGTVITPVAALVLTNRLPNPDGAQWGRRTDDGYFDRLALEDRRILVLADDRFAGHPDAEVVGRDEMIERFATAFSARMTAVIDTIRANVVFGKRGLWAGVHDEIAAVAMWAAREAKSSDDDAWQTAQALCARLEAISTVRPSAPPRRLPIDDPGHQARMSFVVRGTCCLVYKALPAGEPVTDEAYCVTCPLIDDEARTPRMIAYLSAHDAEHVSEHAAEHAESGV